MPRVSPKDPDSEEWFNWDCTKTIQSAGGGTIASILAGPITEEGDDAITVIVGAAVDTSGLIISAKLGGGTSDVDYKLTMRFTTTNGETLDHSLEVFCANGVT